MVHVCHSSAGKLLKRQQRSNTDNTMKPSALHSNHSSCTMLFGARPMPWLLRTKACSLEMHHVPSVAFHKQNPSQQVTTTNLRISLQGFIRHDAVWCNALLAAHRRQSGAPLTVSGSSSGRSKPSIRLVSKHQQRATFLKVYPPASNEQSG